MKKLIKSLILLTAIFLYQQAFSQKPYKEKLEGYLTANGLKNGDCVMQSLTIGYRLGTLVGEPTVYLNVKWKGQDANSDCFANERFRVYLNIGMGGLGYYVIAGGSADMIVGKGNDEWGNNPLAGSPNWDKVIARNTAADPKKLIYVPAEEAKRIWKDGFNVHGATLVTKSGQAIDF